MWCEHCRQNVAGMVSQDSVCCSRCGESLPGDVPTPPTATAPPLPCPAPPRPSLDDWETEEDLRRMERLLRRDAPRLQSPAWHQETTGYARERAPLPSPASTPAAAAGSSWLRTLRASVSWLLICVGLAATVCGGVLLGWTWLGQRPELLIAGLACAAAGQLGLLTGLLIQPPALPVPTASQEIMHPASQWLDIHRRIDDILRADLPERSTPPGGGG